MPLVTLGRIRARRGDPEVAVVLDEALTLATRMGELQRLRARLIQTAGPAGSGPVTVGPGHDQARLLQPGPVLADSVRVEGEGLGERADRDGVVGGTDGPVDLDPGLFPQRAGCLVQAVEPVH